MLSQRKVKYDLFCGVPWYRCEFKAEQLAVLIEALDRFQLTHSFKALYYDEFTSLHQILFEEAVCELGEVYDCILNDATEHSGVSVHD